MPSPFTVLFAVELVIKVVGLTPKGHVTDRYNIFDAVVVAVSVMDLALTMGSSLAVFCALRVGRVLRAARVVRVTA